MSAFTDRTVMSHMYAGTALSGWLTHANSGPSPT